MADYSEFTTSHREFLLFSNGPDWDLPSLMHEGWSVQLLSSSGHGEIYRVEMKNAGEDRTTTQSVAALSH
jgi:hypothetical protein